MLQKVIDAITTVISFIPRVISVLKVVGEIAEKVADFLQQFGKPKV